MHDIHNYAFAHPGLFAIFAVALLILSVRTTFISALYYAEDAAPSHFDDNERQAVYLVDDIFRDGSNPDVARRKYIFSL